MAGEGLFEDLPEQARPERDGGAGAPRLRRPARDQIELRAVDLDSLLAADHLARIIWRYVEGLDLRALYEPIKAREGAPGHPPIDPGLMLGLWLYATSDGVGSARALERLCESHDAYRWLYGGVSVNHHTLGDFRLAHPGVLDELLAKNVAALAAAGLIDLDELTQDGIRVRAAAGGSSFRRRETAARDREARAAAALEKLAEIEAQREQREKKKGKEKDRGGSSRCPTAASVRPTTCRSSVRREARSSSRSR
jgi:transposase